MGSANNRFMAGIWKYVITAFALVASIFAVVYFSDELNIKEYLPYIIIAGVVIHLVLFELYRKENIKRADQKKNELGRRPVQPWEKE